MTVDAKAVRALVAEEAQKVPLQIQVVPRKMEPTEALIVGLANFLLAGLMFMWGLRALHEMFPAVPAAGYLDCTFAILGANAVGAALGMTRIGVLR